jgi:hypothetical protein
MLADLGNSAILQYGRWCFLAITCVAPATAGAGEREV